MHDAWWIPSSYGSTEMTMTSGVRGAFLQPQHLGDRSGESRFQGLPWLHCKFWVTLGYIRPCLIPSPTLLQKKGKDLGSLVLVYFGKSSFSLASPALCQGVTNTKSPLTCDVGQGVSMLCHKEVTSPVPAPVLPKGMVRKGQ